MSSLDQRIASLNSAQRRAVNAITGGWDSPNGDFYFPIIEGPPGTGKTYIGTVAAAKYLNDRGGDCQIAYLCYTNLASDRALDGLVNLRLSPDQVVRVAETAQRRNYQRNRNYGYYFFYDDENELLESQKRRLRNTPVLITTLLSANKILRYQSKPLIIIDEFSQVPPHLFFSTISKVRTKEKHNPEGYTLLGDPDQLPYTTSQPLLRPNIGLFIAQRHNYEPHQLEIQYRMHPTICQTVNALRQALNTYPLSSHPSTTSKNLLTDGYIWDPSTIPQNLLEIIQPANNCVIIDTDHLPGYEQVGIGQSSYYSSEAILTSKIAQYLNASYSKPNGEKLLPVIISPYNAQIGVIKNNLPEVLASQCISVHQSQGREYPCVIISFTRKNEEHRIGFLGQELLRAQTYVACSRAESKLIILLSKSTFYGHGFTDFDNLIDGSKGALFIDAERSWIE